MPPCLLPGTNKHEACKKHSKHLHFPGAYPRISPRDRPFSPACLQPAWRAFVLLTVTAQQQHAVSLSFGQRNGRLFPLLEVATPDSRSLRGKNCNFFLLTFSPSFCYSREGRKKAFSARSSILRLPPPLRRPRRRRRGRGSQIHLRAVNI